MTDRYDEEGDCCTACDGTTRDPIGERDERAPGALGSCEACGGTGKQPDGPGDARNREETATCGACVGTGRAELEEPDVQLVFYAPVYVHISGGKVVGVTVSDCETTTAPHEAWKVIEDDWTTAALDDADVKRAIKAAAECSWPQWQLGE